MYNNKGILLSTSDLCKKLNFSYPTIYKNTRELYDKGFLDIARTHDKNNTMYLFISIRGEKTYNSIKNYKG